MDAESVIQFCSIGFYICLAITILGAACALLVFFRGNVRKVLAIRSGRTAKKAIQKMNEESSRTGRLRSEQLVYESGDLTAEIGPRVTVTNVQAQAAGAGYRAPSDPADGQTVPLSQRTDPLPQKAGPPAEPKVPEGFHFQMTQDMVVTHSDELI